MTSNVTILAALVAGLVSFLSPCVLPLVPPYIIYLAGTSLERLADAEPEPRVRHETVLAAFLFVCGFSTVFVALGAGAGFILIIQRGLANLFLGLSDATGLIFLKSIDPLGAVAGIAIMIMGLHFLGLFQLKFLMREKRFEVPKPVGLWGAYVMGLAFAFGWTPCIGPILTAILAVAAAEQTAAKGAGLLAVYSLGLGIPFLLAAFAVEPFAAFIVRFRRHLPKVERVMGLLLVLTGLAFSSGWLKQLGTWLIDTFPIFNALVW